MQPGQNLEKNQTERQATPTEPGDTQTELGGVTAFIEGVSHWAQEALARGDNGAWFVRRLGEEYAYIVLQDIWHPLRFLRQMAGEPPVAFGTEGFHHSLVDDQNPARHYIAFVCMGYWLPRPLALLSLWMWEIAGFVRYGGVWSWKDMRSGFVGLRHGRMVRKYGPSVLPGLIAAEVAEPPQQRDHA